MSEFVGYRRERMIPEYEQMKKKQIFSDEEMRAIMKTRESYEYKISKQAKCIKDYVEYIAYERRILNLVGEREKNRKDKMTSIQYAIANHIKGLYKEAMSLFPQESRLWDNFIKYCKHAKFNGEISGAFEAMLQYHGDKPDAWLRAAMWEYHENLNIEKVNDLFCRGIQRHPDNTKLYLQFIRVMLLEAQKAHSDLNIANNTESLQSLSLKRATTVYKSSIKKIHDVHYTANLLHTAEEFTFTKEFQKLIISDMMSSFPREETTWHVLAQRELRGFHTCDLRLELSKQHKTSNYTASHPITPDPYPADYERNQYGFIQRTPKRQIELCYEIYCSAVKTLKTAKMWKLFINAMLELNQDMSTQRVLKRKKLGAAFKAANEANCMSEDHYYSYINLLCESESQKELALQVMEKAIRLHPTTVKLWQQWLYHYISENNEPKVLEIFRKAEKVLGANSYSIWKITLQFYQTRHDLAGKLNSLFQEACRFTRPTFVSFRAQYLEWTIISKGLDYTRKLYEIMTEYPPPSLELHQRMAFLESITLKPDTDKWRRCHEYSVHYFGKTRTDVWIEYIKFERDFGNPKNMSTVFERAKETLDTDVVDNFITEHCLLTTGLM